MPDYEYKAPKAKEKKADRVRVLRSAANGWEYGSVKDVVDGVPLTAKLDSGDTVGLTGTPWEAVVKLTKQEEQDAAAKAEKDAAKAAEK